MHPIPVVLDKGLVILSTLYSASGQNLVVFQIRHGHTNFDRLG